MEAEVIEEEIKDKLRLLQNSYEKKIYDQNQLLNISKALNSNLNLYSLLESIIDICLTKSLGMQVGIFLVPEVDQKDLVLYRHSVGFYVNNHNLYVVPKKSYLYLLLEKLQIPMLLSNLIEEYYIKKNKAIDHEIILLLALNKDLIIIPMYYQSKMNGIIIIGLYEENIEISIYNSEVMYLRNLSSIASIAVHNAYLYKLATIDMMTKLHIHHYFKMMLTELFDDANQKFCLILTDIDHFKKFNDNHGHQVGDVVLKQVASVLLTQCRETDLKCRYGGEEFVIILYNAKLLEAQITAEKIRKKVEELTVKNPFTKEKETSQNELKVTISLGVAEYSNNLDSTPDDLIKRCDVALYRAKDKGRNRVEISS